MARRAKPVDAPEDELKLADGLTPAGLVTAGQIILLGGSVALFAAGLAASIGRAWWNRPASPKLSRMLVLSGLAVGLASLIWHSMYRGNWFPLEDNFDALAWLGLLLAGFVLYMQTAHPLRGLDWFLLPAAMLLLAMAGIFGATRSHEYSPHNAWLWVHRMTAYGGAAAFAVSASVGAMYLITRRSLLRKSSAPGPNLGSLERLERLTQSSVTLGFALLTVGMVTGYVRAIDSGTTSLGSHWFASPKVLLTTGVWVIYALALHTPMNPSFRGRKAAVLSVVGFILMVATLIAVQFVPASSG